MRKPVRLLVLLGLGGLVYWVFASSRALAEEVDYLVVEKDGAFELRDYPKLAVVSAPMKEDGSNSAFRRLFRFISGDNSEQRKIAMTAPVFMEVERMTFIMPKGMTNVPRPSDPGVEVDTLPPARLATVRFGGFGTAAAEAKAKETLLREVRERGLIPDGEAFIAYYDSPWVPPPFRRNEAMVPVQRR